MVKKCIVCGKVYTTERQRKYCSNACRGKQWKINNREKYLLLASKYAKRHWQRIKPKISKKNCLVCYKLFMPSSKQPYQKFCGRKCRMAYYRKNNKIKVAIWKKNDKIKHKEQYSKRDAEYHDKMRYGGNRRKAMVRDEFKCQACEREYPDVLLVVHHVDFTGQNETPNQELKNLQTLCRACHARIHKLIV